MLCLRDPADETNDLGRKGIAIKHVQTTFAHLHAALTRDVNTNTRHSLLTRLVGTSYMLNLPRRNKLRDYGMQLSQKTRISLAETARAIREADKVGEKQQEAAVHPKDVETPQQKAEEEQDKEPQGPAKETNEVLQAKAQKSTVSEYSDTVPHSVGISAVGAVTDSSQPAENVAAQSENNAKGA